MLINLKLTNIIIKNYNFNLGDVFDLNCDSNGIAGQPVNCNLTFLTQDQNLAVYVSSYWNSFLSGYFFKIFRILNRNQRII